MAAALEEAGQRPNGISDPSKLGGHKLKSDCTKGRGLVHWGTPCGATKDCSRGSGEPGVIAGSKLREGEPDG